jgi:hypothetical protein
MTAVGLGGRAWEMAFRRKSRPIPMARPSPVCENLADVLFEVAGLGAPGADGARPRTQS